MRLSFFTMADFYDESDSKVIPPSTLNQREVSNLRMADYLDFELADKGVVEGIIRIWVKDTLGGLGVIFWMPELLSSDLVDQLRNDVVAQLDDGVGEGGFELLLDDQSITVIADTNATIRHEFIDDGKEIPYPCPIAIAAREGDISSLRQRLESRSQEIDTFYQGYTALHLAIIYGHFEAIKLLMTSGANPNLNDLNDTTPLEGCALASSLNDNQSYEITKLLLEAGADPDHVQCNGETAKTYAICRQKNRMAELL